MTSEHYKNTYNKLFNELPKWKQLAIKSDSQQNNWTGMLNDFIQNVIYIAEKEFEQNQHMMLVDNIVPYNSEKETKPKKKIKNKKN